MCWERPSRHASKPGMQYWGTEQWTKAQGDGQGIAIIRRRERERAGFFMTYLRAGDATIDDREGGGPGRKVDWLMLTTRMIVWFRVA